MTWKSEIKKEIVKTTNKKNIIKKITLIPEVNIRVDQIKNTIRVWPISGCNINNKATITVKKKENEYLK